MIFLASVCLRRDAEFMSGGCMYKVDSVTPRDRIFVRMVKANGIYILTCAYNY